MPKISRFCSFLLLYSLFITPLLAVEHPRLDLTGEFFVKNGFDPADRGGFSIEGEPEERVKRRERLPVQPNTIFEAEQEDRIREYAIMTRFSASAELQALAHPALKLKGIGENWAIFLNGKLIHQEIHLDDSGNIQRYRLVRDLIVPLDTGSILPENVLVFRVLGHAPASPLSKNIHLGLTVSRGYALGDSEQLRAETDQTFQTVLYGVYIFFGLYHLLFFARMRRHKYNLFFGLFSITLAFYFLAISARAQDIFTDTSHGIVLAYATQPLALGLFLGFLFTYFYPERPISPFMVFVAVSNFVMMLAMLFAPYRFTQTSLYAWYMVAVPQLLYVFFFLGRAIYQRLPDAKTMAVGLSSGILFAIWEIIDTIFFHTQLRLIQYAHLMIVLSLVAILANRFLAVHISSERLNVELTEQRNAFSRFVPTKFLEHLNQVRVQDVRLGDYTEREMTVLVSDIRNFTSMSEEMSPQRNFEYLNEYLGRMGPIIRRHQGFIDKYIGDAIMALFPAGTEHALRAAIEMRQEVEKFNDEHADTDQPRLDVGIGIHTGKLVLGTIGEDERMEGTVISDAVNQAFRLESLTKKLGASVIVSTPSLHGLPDPTVFSVRFLGKARVKGKSDMISIYELLDGLPAALQEERLATRDDFEKALFHYYNKEFDTAASILGEIEEAFPGDRAVQTYTAASAKAARLQSKVGSST